MITARTVIRHSTLWVAVVAVVSLLLTLWYFFANQPASYAGGNEVLSGQIASKQSVAQWKDVAKKASEAISKGNNDEAISILSLFKSQLLSTRVSSEMTATHLNRVLDLERIIEKIRTKQPSEEIQDVLRVFTTHF